MKNLPTAEEARQWLTVQLEVLEELRTAGPRNPAFQQWRNNTIALAERIWPHQNTKYKRFRRIPFQPSAAKSSDRETRECYERGCAEARRVISLWISEINLHGLLHAGAGETPDTMPDLGDAPASEVPTERSTRAPRRGTLGRPKATEDITRTGHVPKGRAFGVRGESTARGPAKAPAKKSKPRLKDMLGLGDPEVEPAPPAPQRLATPPQNAIPMLRQPGPATPAPPSSSGEFTIERLERPSPADHGPDVLEKSIFEAMQAALAKAEAGTPEAAPREADGREAKEAAPVEPPSDAQVEAAASAEEVRAEADEAPADDPSEKPEEPEAEAVATAKEEEPVAEAEMPARATEADHAEEPDKFEIPEEFRKPKVQVVVKSGPSSRKAAEPVPPAPSAEPAGEPVTPRAHAVSEIVRLASDLDLLGVPESEQRALKNVLLEAGRTLDSDAPEWGAIEDAIARGVRHPALARKLLPLLTPFLDEAA